MTNDQHSSSSPSSSTGHAGSISKSANTPKVSVIMATFNCEDTIATAMDSILEQTYENWELVICDDGSTDGTVDVISQVAPRFGSRLSMIQNTSNMKLPFSLNRCLDSATGELVARMDGDDISEPDRLERQVRFLAEHPDIHLVGSAMRRFNDRGVGDVVFPAATRPDRGTLGRGMSVPFFHATIMARREVFDRVGNYTVSWRTERGQDVDLWFKFFREGLVGENLPEPLYRVREDENAIRRRTPRARLGGYVTRLIGYRSLDYPVRPYVRSTASLVKILIPYKAYSLHRSFLSWWSVRRREEAQDVVAK